MTSNLLLFFPPLTEAKFFPYLSLPMITSYLRKMGHEVYQADLNLDLYLDLFSEKEIKEYIEVLGEMSGLKARLSESTLKYCLRNFNTICDDVFSKSTNRRASVNNINLVNNAASVLLDDSLLAHIPERLDEMDVRQPQNDMAFNKCLSRVDDYIGKSKPKVIGFSIAFFSQLYPSIIISNYIKKKYHNIKIVFGGQQIIMRYESLLNPLMELGCVDYLGIGDGENTLKKLIEHIDGSCGFEDIPDIVNIEAGAKNDKTSRDYGFDSSTPPDFNGLKLNNYLNDEVQIPLITCIGCYWGRCKFCSYGNRSYESNNYRVLSAKNIASQVMEVVQRYDVKRVNFVDENTDIKLVLKAMKLVRKAGFSVEYTTRNRLEKSLANIRFCRELKEYGCIIISAGYETNSQRILDLIDKGVNSDLYQKIVDNLHEVGIDLNLSIMGGLPTETEEEVLDSYNFLVRNQNRIGVDVMQMLILEPKTRLLSDLDDLRMSVDYGSLQSNRLLNFGGGRFGPKYNYVDKLDFDQRAIRFASKFSQINAEKSLNKPRLIITKSPPKNAGFVFMDWIDLIVYEGRSYLFDIITNNIYHCSEKIKMAENILYIDKSEVSLIQKVSNENIGVVV